MPDQTDYPCTFDGLMKVVSYLRGDDGCPWDRKQTAQSMRSSVLEECYELLEAIDNEDPSEIISELGDLIFNLAFQIHLGTESGTFEEADVFQSVISKLVRRHPHVFGDGKISDADQVLNRWQSLKKAEREEGMSIMNSVPSKMPALVYAQTLQNRAAGAGFDWEDVSGVVEKITEEITELNNATDADEQERELGDLLFSIVNLARWLDIDAESALRTADSRFRTRYELMEKLSHKHGLVLEALSVDEKDRLWQKAKRVLDAGA